MCWKALPNFPSGELRGQLISQGLFGTATGTAGARAFAAVPKITWAAPAAMAYGVPLSATQLNATASTAGAFTYSPPAGTVLAPGAQTLSVLFTPTDTTAFITASASVPITVTNAAPVFVSPPIATPNPAAAGQSVTFVAVVSDNDPIASFAWDFGDGSTGMGALITHAFAAAGSYSVNVAAADSLGLTTSSAVMMTVSAPSVPPGSVTDADGDGFSDNLETAAGTSPNDPASTPLNGARAPAPLPLPDLKLSIKLNFARPNSDSITLSGSLLLSDGYNVAGKTMLLEVGNVAKVFTLDAKGSAKVAGNSVTVKSKGTAARIAKFSVKISKESLGDKLAATGLVNATMTKEVAVPVTILIDSKIFQKAQAQNYKATQGKSGTGSDKKG